MVKEDTTHTGEAGSRVLTKPLPQILNELEEQIKAADAAVRRANESAGLAEQAAQSAIAAAEESRLVGGRIAEEARLEAQEALSKAEEALIKAVMKRLSRWDWIATLIVINLAIIFCAVLIAFAMAKAL
ncbi:MAG: alanine-zipper protein [Dehalococcoidales bacterium]|nr:alanine-zipper protein [Dehalococcoidales bacterium]